MATYVKQPEYPQDEAFDYMHHRQDALVKTWRQWSEAWFDFGEHLLKWQREYWKSVIDAASYPAESHPAESHPSKEPPWPTPSPKPTPYPTAPQEAHQ